MTCTNDMSSLNDIYEVSTSTDRKGARVLLMFVFDVMGSIWGSVGEHSAADSCGAGLFVPAVPGSSFRSSCGSRSFPCWFLRFSFVRFLRFSFVRFLRLSAARFLWFSAFGSCGSPLLVPVALRFRFLRFSFVRFLRSSVSVPSIPAVLRRSVPALFRFLFLRLSAFGSCGFLSWLFLFLSGGS